MTKKKGDDSELVKKNTRKNLDKDKQSDAKSKSIKKSEQQSNKLPRKVYKEVPFLDINFASLKCKALIIRKVLTFVVDVIAGKANISFDGPVSEKDKLKLITKCCQCVVENFDVVLFKSYDKQSNLFSFFFAYIRGHLCKWMDGCT
jgi:hypothetical protein